ncbi:hypothetical protein V8G54_035561 [Vigna mungo]|uniref:SAWADEE domain-containing protein n=1 Tax=Vigna mungo TaxID=3915 RepID=A0AAQ3MFI2_VIGMU
MNYSTEFRAYEDDAWYTVCLLFHGDTLTVKFLGFPTENDVVFQSSYFQNLKDLEVFKRRFRPLSKQLQDEECGLVTPGTRVCACHLFNNEDVRFYDAVVDGVFNGESFLLFGLGKLNLLAQFDVPPFEPSMKSHSNTMPFNGQTVEADVSCPHGINDNEEWNSVDGLKGGTSNCASRFNLPCSKPINHPTLQRREKQEGGVQKYSNAAIENLHLPTTIDYTSFYES